eukprot:3481940-Pleurochrysis_carterae.AAC.6
MQHIQGFTKTRKVSRQDIRQSIFCSNAMAVLCKHIESRSYREAARSKARVRRSRVVLVEHDDVALAVVPAVVGAEQVNLKVVHLDSSFIVEEEVLVILIHRVEGDLVQLAYVLPHAGARGSRQVYFHDVDRQVVKLRGDCIVAQDAARSGQRRPR